MKSKLLEILNELSSINTNKLESYMHKFSSEITSVDDCLMVGNFFQSRKNYAVALSYFEKALSIDIKCQEALYNCSACCYVLNDIQKSLEYLIKLSNEKLHCDINVPALSLCKKLNATSLAYRFMSSIKVWDLELLVLRCEINALSGVRHLCIGDLNYLLNIKNISSNHLKRLSIISAKMKDYDLAIKFNNQYLSQVGKNPIDCIRTTDLYLMSRNLDLAKQSIGFWEEDPVNDFLLSKKELLLAKIQRLEGRYEESLISASRAVLIDSSLSEAWSILSDLSKEEDLPELINNLEAVVTHKSMNDFNLVNSLYSLGKMKDRLNLKNEAFECWTQSNKLQHRSLKEKNKLYSSDRQRDFFYKFVNFRSRFTDIPNDQLPIFVVGVPRSGTTLLEKLLGQHPDVQTCGEIETIPLISSHFIDSINGMSSQYQYEEIVKKHRDDYFAQAKISRKCFVDKMPHNIGYISVIKAIFPNAKIIVMERNVLDVALSVFKHNFSDGHNYACNLDDIVDYYYLTKSITQTWVSRYPDDIKVVSYEKLVENPSEVMSKVYKFLGFRWEDEYLHLKRHDKPSYTFSELQVRKTINNKGVGSWKKYHDQILRDLSENNKKKISIDFPELSLS
ncbi:hypothetical protein MAH1_36640 [Sessilibacter sp. MAH1]